MLLPLQEMKNRNLASDSTVNLYGCLTVHDICHSIRMTMSTAGIKPRTFNIGNCGSRTTIPGGTYYARFSIRFFELSVVAGCPIVYPDRTPRCNQA